MLHTSSDSTHDLPCTLPPSWIRDVEAEAEAEAEAGGSGTFSLEAEAEAEAVFES